MKVKRMESYSEKYEKRSCDGKTCSFIQSILSFWFYIENKASVFEY